MVFSALNQFTDILCQATPVKADLADSGVILMSGEPYTRLQLLTQHYHMPLNLAFLDYIVTD